MFYFQFVAAVFGIYWGPLTLKVLIFICCLFDYVKMICELYVCVGCAGFEKCNVLFPFNYDFFYHFFKSLVVGGVD